MVDQDKQEDIKTPSPSQISRSETSEGKKRISPLEQAAAFKHDPEGTPEKILEKKEISQDEKIISEELRREIDLMQLDDNLKKQAEQKANIIQFLADDDKLEKLMEIAREKGVIFAIQVAKKMNEPFLLDTLHDTLAREGYYKDFTR